MALEESASNSENNSEIAKVENQPAEQPSNNEGAPPQRQPTTMESFFSITKSLIIRALIIYFITSFFRRPAPPATNSTGNPLPSTAARNIFVEGTPLTLHVYITEEPVMTKFTPANLFWYKDNLVYGDWNSGLNQDGIYTVQKDLPITPHMLNNGSLYLHAFVTKMGESPDPNASNYARNLMTRFSKQLNRFKKLKSSGTKNLITGESEAVEVEEGKIVSHWHPNFTINIVVDETGWTYGAVPAPLDQFIKFTKDAKYYKPVLYGNDFWNMARDYKPLNETDKSYTLRVIYQPISLFKWQLYVTQSMRQMWNIWGEKETETDEEQDTLKETLMDTNPYLLGVTIVVSILHSLFELLAFKNDIQFWNNRNSLEGLSVRSVFFGVFQSLVVLLYVLDNEVNTLIRVSCFIGLGIELWKIYKVVDIKFENGRLVFKDKGSYVESSTKYYDNLAFKYLSWLCFPLLFGYSIYALLYQEHKGWYSFILNLLYGFLLTFGFIMMTPQLFINYKLKSVAHLPWRMLTYKFLNTFIDDMFAFVIKMPTMYRLGCLRDDVVFLVFLYQRWIYPVDKTRKNEFGYSAENDEVKAIENNQNENTVAVSEENKKDK